MSIFFELCLWIKGRVDCTRITISLSRTLQCNIFVPGQSWIVKSFMRTWVLESEPASDEMLLCVYSRQQETIDTSNMQASLVVVHLWAAPQLTDLWSLDHTVWFTGKKRGPPFSFMLLVKHNIPLNENLRKKTDPKLSRETEGTEETSQTPWDLWRDLPAKASPKLSGPVGHACSSDKVRQTWAMCQHPQSGEAPTCALPILIAKPPPSSLCRAFGHATFFLLTQHVVFGQEAALGSLWPASHSRELSGTQQNNRFES